MNKAKYICFEGTEGVGKSTQTQLLVDSLKRLGYKVLATKEPGSVHSPLTMTLRNIMLDNKYNTELTKSAREFISQAIRSIHLEKVIIPAYRQYDYIIQDRGILSGLAYGTACGNSLNDISSYAKQITHPTHPHLSPEHIYDLVIYLQGDTTNDLKKALSAKQEFETGDAMESRGDQFMENVSTYMNILSDRFRVVKIKVIDKTIKEVHEEILINLKLRDI